MSKMLDALKPCFDNIANFAKYEALSEIIAIIELRIAQNAEQQKGCGEEWKLVHQGRENAYRDIKQIIEQIYTEGNDGR